MPSAETWRIRKEETIELLEKVEDPAVKLICLGDKLSNMRAIHRDFEELGDALWGRFNQKDPAQHAWYYRSLAKVLETDFGETVAWRELATHVDAVFGGLQPIPKSGQWEGTEGRRDTAPAGGYWYCAETEEELADLLEMFWEFHDFRIEEMGYSAAEDRIDLQLEYDTHEFRVVLSFTGGAFMNFSPGYCYPADWLQGASLGLGEQGRVVWVADEGVDPKDLPIDVLWISGFALNYAMIDCDGRLMDIPGDVVHQERRSYDYKTGKWVEHSRDFLPRRLCGHKEMQSGDGAS